MVFMLLVWLQVVGFYEFYEGLQEGWDGPALLVFSDGEHVGARLDRNGLRPARFWVTSNDMVYVASEASIPFISPHPLMLWSPPNSMENELAALEDVA